MDLVYLFCRQFDTVTQLGNFMLAPAEKFTFCEPDCNADNLDILFLRPGRDSPLGGW